MSDLWPITLDDMIGCIERELALRGNLYPRWVHTKRMRKDNADREMALMEAVLATLKKLKEESMDDG